MNELIDQTISIVQKSSELLKQTGTDELVKTAAKGFFGWLANIFTKNSAKEKLKLIEDNKANQDTISGLKANLEFVLEDNQELQKQLENKVKELATFYKNQLPQINISSNSAIGNNSSNNIIIQGISSGNNTNLNITK